MKIEVITTGGTIDGADLDSGSKLPSSALLAFLSNEPDLEIKSCELFNKDSREITQADREALSSRIDQAESDKILVGHGTFTIVETARFLKSHFSNSSKSIVLVGSWIPFGEPSSDAPNQVRGAIQSLRIARPGVTIFMDGRTWDPDITEKRQVQPGRWSLVEV